MFDFRGTVVGLGLLWLSAASPAASAQTLNNDGFQRRNGQMHVLRNGQLRPMIRDAHLPTGAVVTKDGFVISRTGQRTELGEGQGCDLKGNLVSVRSGADGRLALGAPRAAGRSARPASSAEERAVQVLTDLLGGRRGEEG